MGKLTRNALYYLIIIILIIVILFGILFRLEPRNSKFKTLFHNNIDGFILVIIRMPYKRIALNTKYFKIP